MKFLILVCVFVAVACGNELPPELKEKWLLCLKKHGQNEDVLKTLTQPIPLELKCVSACVLTEFGLFDDNGKLNQEEMHKVSKEVGGKMRIEYTDEIKTFISECTTKANEKTDKCDIAAEFYKCKYDKMHTEKSD